MKYTTLALSLFIFTQSGTLHPQELIAHPTPINHQWPSYVAGAALLGTTAWVGCYLYKKHTRKWQRKHEFLERPPQVQPPSFPPASQPRIEEAIIPDERHEILEYPGQPQPPSFPLASQPCPDKTVTKGDLFNSVKDGNFNLLKSKIRLFQGDITQLTQKGRDLLRHAINSFSKYPTQSNRKNIISLLITKGFQPTEVHRQRAIQKGISNPEVLTWLKCPQQIQPQSSHENSLFYHVQEGDFKELNRLILLFQGNLSDVKDKKGKDLLRYALHLFSQDQTQSNRKNIISLLITNGFQPTKVHRERAIAKKITDIEILESLGCPLLLIEAIQNEQEDLILYAINSFTQEKIGEIGEMIQLLVNSEITFTQAHHDRALSKEGVTPEIIAAWTSQLQA